MSTKEECEKSGDAVHRAEARLLQAEYFTLVSQREAVVAQAAATAAAMLPADATYADVQAAVLGAVAVARSQSVAVIQEVERSCRDRYQEAAEKHNALVREFRAQEEQK